MDEADDYQPMYGPKGRWKQLRQERDDAMAEAERLREELGSLSGLYVACRDDYERIWTVLEEIADGYERHNPGWWIKKAKAALRLTPTGTA